MRNFTGLALDGLGSASKNGIQFDSGQWVSASFHFYAADSGSEGTLKLQASNDTGAQKAGYAAPLDAFTVTNWVDIPNQSAAITTGSSALLTIPNMTYRWIRCVWTRSGGTATVVTCNVNALSI